MGKLHCKPMPKLKSKQRGARTKKSGHIFGIRTESYLKLRKWMMLFDFFGELLSGHTRINLSGLNTGVP